MLKKVRRDGTLLVNGTEIPAEVQINQSKTSPSTVRSDSKGKLTCIAKELPEMVMTNTAP